MRYVHVTKLPTQTQIANATFLHPINLINVKLLPMPLNGFLVLFNGLGSLQFRENSDEHIFVSTTHDNQNLISTCNPKLSRHPNVKDLNSSVALKATNCMPMFYHK